MLSNSIAHFYFKLVHCSLHFLYLYVKHLLLGLLDCKFHLVQLFIERIVKVIQFFSQILLRFNSTFVFLFNHFWQTFVNMWLIFPYEVGDLYMSFVKRFKIIFNVLMNISFFFFKLFMNIQCKLSLILFKLLKCAQEICLSFICFLNGFFFREKLLDLFLLFFDLSMIIFLSLNKFFDFIAIGINLLV